MARLPTRPRRVLVALAAAGAIAGCGSGGHSAAESGIASGQVAGSVPSGRPDLAAPQEVARGIDVPWGLAFLPGGDALVAERDTGRILRLRPGSAPQEVYRVPGVDAGGEGGLLGLAVSPQYSGDGLVYAYFTAAQDNRVARFRLDGGEPQVVVDGIAKAGNHNGGRIAFGPDGLLYVGTGDAGVTSRSQDRNSRNGKILRVAPDGTVIVHSLGHRNVQGLAWDTEGRLFATEFGQNDVDEINLIAPGRNYGWPDVEGVSDTAGGQYTNPLLTWPTSEASPSGIAISGTTAYVAALRGERLWTVPLTGATTGTPSAALQGRYGRLRTVQVAPDGALWVTTSNTDGRGDVNDGDDRVLRFPAR
jgi:glucose/arabinose dehydrogenase